MFTDEWFKSLGQLILIGIAGATVGFIVYLLDTTGDGLLYVAGFYQERNGILLSGVNVVTSMTVIAAVLLSSSKVIDKLKEEKTKGYAYLCILVALGLLSYFVVKLAENKEKDAAIRGVNILNEYIYNDEYKNITRIVFEKDSYRCALKSDSTRKYLVEKSYKEYFVKVSYGAFVIEKNSDENNHDCKLLMNQLNDNKNNSEIIKEYRLKILRDGKTIVDNDSGGSLYACLPINENDKCKLDDDELAVTILENGNCFMNSGSFQSKVGRQEFIFCKKGVAYKNPQNVVTSTIDGYTVKSTSDRY